MQLFMFQFNATIFFFIISSSFANCIRWQSSWKQCTTIFVSIFFENLNNFLRRLIFLIIYFFKRSVLKHHLITYQTVTCALVLWFLQCKWNIWLIFEKKSMIFWSMFDFDLKIFDFILIFFLNSFWILKKKTRKKFKKSSLQNFLQNSDVLLNLIHC